MTYGSWWESEHFAVQIVLDIEGTMEWFDYERISRNK
jgi:hypothetical protein